MGLQANTNPVMIPSLPLFLWPSLLFQLYIYLHIDQSFNTPLTPYRILRNWLSPTFCGGKELFYGGFEKRAVVNGATLRRYRPPRLLEPTFVVLFQSFYTLLEYSRDTAHQNRVLTGSLPGRKRFSGCSSPHVLWSEFPNASF